MQIEFDLIRTNSYLRSLILRELQKVFIDIFQELDRLQSNMLFKDTVLVKMNKGDVEKLEGLLRKLDVVRDSAKDMVTDFHNKYLDI